MLYGVILALHIVAACVTVATIIGALYAILKNKNEWYALYALGLGAVAALQILSGIALIALNPELSVVKVGLHLLAYLGVCLSVEGALYLKARTAAWTS